MVNQWREVIGRGKPSQWHRPQANKSAGLKVKNVKLHSHIIGTFKLEHSIRTFNRNIQTLRALPQYKPIRPNTNYEAMRNRAAKDAVRWCHLTHQVIAGASVHSREHKTSLVRCIPRFFSKRFTNHSIIN